MLLALMIPNEKKLKSLLQCDHLFNYCCCLLLFFFFCFLVSFAQYSMHEWDIR